jgi:acyl-coenzyme A synthetase/AMP-(fatty) acid ligase
MMWNWQLSALACGARLVGYDGPLAGPETLWRIVAEEEATVFGTSPPLDRHLGAQTREGGTALAAG